MASGMAPGGPILGRFRHPREHVLTQALGQERREADLA